MKNDQIEKVSNSIEISAANELQIASSAATAMQEITATIMVAQRFRRIFNECWASLMNACKRKSLAEIAMYSYPRGSSIISGPSVHLARVAAQCYGNIRWGIEILREDEASILIQGWAWDVEKNVKSSMQDEFKKLIYRKNTEAWVKPDERDLRELVMRRGAILVRNAIYNVIPKDFIEDAIIQCKQTLKSEIKDPHSAKKRLILEFDAFGITVAMLNAYIDSENWSPDNIIELQGILNGLKDGTASKNQYFGFKEKEKATGKLNIESMKPGNTEEHQNIAAPEGKIKDTPSSFTSEEIEESLRQLAEESLKQKTGEQKNLTFDEFKAKGDAACEFEISEHFKELGYTETQQAGMRLRYAGKPLDMLVRHLRTAVKNREKMRGEK